MARFQNGVDDGARTHDRWNHNPELYQLSYAHHCSARYSTIVFCCCTLRGRPAGLESMVAARRFFRAMRENRTAPRAFMRSSRAFGTSRICGGSSPIEYSSLERAHARMGPFQTGAPGRTRTCNPRLRRPVLCPVELRAQLPQRLVGVEGFTPGILRFAPTFKFAPGEFVNPPRFLFQPAFCKSAPSVSVKAADLQKAGRGGGI